MKYTLTYAGNVQGWVSFYSYYPDWMIGMNNYLYTFKGGDLYRHNSNELRNTFYEQWTEKFPIPYPRPSPFYPTTMQSVFNDAVLENKLFKTLTIQGDATWEVSLETDLQNSGYTNASYFEKKESAYFSFIRNSSSGQLPLRSVNGIGNSLTVVNGIPTTEINFSINPLVAIGSILSVGDYVYFSSSVIFAGIVTQINVNYTAGINQIIIDVTPPGTTPIPSDTEFILYIKNSVAESHGVLGHYCVFNIQNYSSSKIELFTFGTEVMKSYP
jgi:hypothetical protein